MSAPKAQQVQFMFSGCLFTFSIELSGIFPLWTFICNKLSLIFSHFFHVHFY